MSAFLASLIRRGVVVAFFVALALALAAGTAAQADQQEREPRHHLAPSTRDASASVAAVETHSAPPARTAFAPMDVDLTRAASAPAVFGVLAAGLLLGISRAWAAPPAVVCVQVDRARPVRCSRAPPVTA